jgi:hypothetical protein
MKISSPRVKKLSSLPSYKSPSGRLKDFFPDEDFLIFFDREGIERYGNIVNTFPKKSLPYKIIVLHNIQDQLSDLNYYFPEIHQTLSFHNIIESLFDLFKYVGDIRTGFILFSGSTPLYVIEYNEQDVDFLYEYIQKIIYREEENFSDSQYQLVTKPKKQADRYFNDYPLTEETKALIQNIKDNLDKLRASGQLFFVLPILDEILRSLVSDSQVLLSSVRVDPDNIITFPMYNNKELKLSHLTKTIYLFFMRHPNGIYLSELYLYKEELRKLYRNISNQNDYEKMLQTIEDLVLPNSNAIYPHLSRIKNALYQMMYKDIADRYCIVSDKENKDLKYIPYFKESKI